MMSKRSIDNDIADKLKRHKDIIWEISELWAQHKILLQRLRGKPSDRQVILDTLEHIQDRITELQQHAKKLHDEIYVGIGAK